MGNKNSVPSDHHTEHLYHKSKPEIKVNIEGHVCDVNDKLVIDLVYLKEEKMKNIFVQITNKLHQKYYPLKLEIYRIKDTSFTDHGSSLKEIEAQSITEYEINDITKKGLNIKVSPNYIHQIKCESIDCKYMNKIKSTDALHCPIYYAMKEEYKWNKDNLHHLYEYTHFENEYNDKAKCKHMDQCKAYIRMENGGNNINDECHMKLYRHPPRTRNIKLQQNVNAFIINKKTKQNHGLHQPTGDEKIQYKYNQKDGYLYALIEEVIYNGFKSDLCLFCAPNDECKHNEHSTLTIVDDKMDHYRHKAMNKPLNRGEMLSLILYTGCDCNYDLCRSQRNGDYNKWKWFDRCLYQAISRLSFRESGSFTVYSGLNNVKLSTKGVKSGYFRTYVSTSWHKNIAKTFMNGDGMIINFDKQFKDEVGVNCCDVSWISKFPDECEVLFGRSKGEWNKNFECSILDNSHQIQIVSLKVGPELRYDPMGELDWR